MIDFHSHVLPGIDDGAKNVSESIAILKAAYLQGTNTIVATPHYYPSDMSISRFLKRRERAYNELKKELELSKMPHPKIVLGAEVHLTYDLLMMEDISKLCIENTNFILIELPYAGLTEHVQKWLFALIAHKGLIPILAHVERYIDKQRDFDRLLNLLKMDIFTQVNCSSLLQFRGGKYLKKLIKSHSVHLLGTDCHNLTTRSYHLKKTYKTISRRYGKAIVFLLNNNAKLAIEGKRPKKENNY